MIGSCSHSKCLVGYQNRTADTLKAAFAHFDLPADQDCLVAAFKVALESNIHIEFSIFCSSEGSGDGGVCSNPTVRSNRIEDDSDGLNS
jgi:hypothetical protein